MKNKTFSNLRESFLFSDPRGKVIFWGVLLAAVWYATYALHLWSPNPENQPFSYLSGSPTRGARLFSDLGCNACHGLYGVGPDIGPDLQQLGVGAAQFFTNAISTKTKGLDVILTYHRDSGWQRWGASLAANINDMELGTINTSPKLAGKEDIYYGRREQHFLLASAPDSKVNVQVNYGVRNLDALVRFTRFGQVTLIDWLDTEDIYQARITTDASATYQLSRNLVFTIGGDNLFNRYPSPQDTETETGGLWDAVQMGFAGAFYYARLSFKI